MTLHELVGRPVHILVWDDLRDVLPTEPNGTILRVTDFGDGDVEVTVRVAGLGRSFSFGLDEVEILRPSRPPEGRPAADSSVS